MSYAKEAGMMQYGLSLQIVRQLADQYVVANNKNYTHDGTLIKKTRAN